MKFLECFTIDIGSRDPKQCCFGKLVRRLVFEPGYRAVVYYRLAIFLKKTRFANRSTTLLGSLVLSRLRRVPGVEIRTKNEIGAGLSIYHPHNIVIGAGCKIGKKATIYNGVTIGARTLISIDGNKDPATRYPMIND